MFLCSADDLSSGRGADDTSSARGVDDTSSARGADDTSSARGADDIFVTFIERFVHFCLKSHEPMSLFLWQA